MTNRFSQEKEKKASCQCLTNKRLEGLPTDGATCGPIGTTPTPDSIKREIETKRHQRSSWATSAQTGVTRATLKGMSDASWESDAL